MEKPRILYIQDAMCGWCYAFGGILDELRLKHEDFFDFIAVSGGMVVGEAIAPISKLKDFLKDAIPKVEEHSGVKFGEKYLDLVEEGSYVNNSIKPAIALSAFKSMKPFSSVEFAHDIQFEHFYNGKNLNEREVYMELAANYDIDANELLARMNNDQFHTFAKDDFEFVKKLGITGFPCVIGETKKGLYMLSQGYIREEDMDNILAAFRTTIEQGEPDPETSSTTEQSEEKNA
ncbi:MAG: DsbA family protein [Bacteroidota bacterium]|nr:DsbA family protein [Bacteroidota bacterium]